MLRIMVFIQNWFSDSERTHEDRGATMVEYALIVSLIALVAAVGVAAFGWKLSDFFSAPQPSRADLPMVTSYSPIRAANLHARAKPAIGARPSWNTA